MSRSLKIRTFGDPILRERAEPVVDFDDDLRRLVDGMLDTLHETGAKGVAGNQVGVLARVFAWRVDENSFGSCVNPEVVSSSDEVCLDEEGCLSFPRLFRFSIERPIEVLVAYQDIFGARRVTVVRERLARTFLHEIDHLNGILFIDHLANHDHDQVRQMVTRGELDHIPQPNGDPPFETPQYVAPSELIREDLVWGGAPISNEGVRRENT